MFVIFLNVIQTETPVFYKKYLCLLTISEFCTHEQFRIYSKREFITHHHRITHERQRLLYIRCINVPAVAAVRNFPVSDTSAHNYSFQYCCVQ